MSLVLMPPLGARPPGFRAVLGWERGAWDVAASPGYVACDKYGLARSLSCAAVWLAAAGQLPVLSGKRRGERG